MAFAKGMYTGSGDAFGHEAVVVASTAIGFTQATWGAKGSHIRAVVSAEGGVMRYRYDGSNPSSTAGHLLSHGDVITVEGAIGLVNFRAIRCGGTSGTLRITYETVVG